MSATPNAHHRQRLKNFLHPTSGKHIYVARSPEEIDSLRRKLSASGKKDAELDIFISGSPEHLKALRETHSHHSRRRDELRSQHSGVYDELESVRTELDTLSSELHTITEHNVSLNANFSKYGYSAHLRTHGGPSSSSASSALGLNDERHHDWSAERNKGQSIPLFKKPVVRQYFHKGLLWRASDIEEVASFELFVDLLYVGLIAVMGDTAAEDPTGESLLRFAIAFILSYKIWTDLTVMISWFETDDIVQRISVLFIMACLFGFTTNIVESADKTYTQMIAFYLATRFFSFCYFILLYFLIPMIRSFAISSAITVLIPSLLWIGSIYLEEPNRQCLIWVAIVLDLFAANLLIFLVRSLQHMSPGLSKRLEGWMEFYPGINIEHKTSRMNAFISLVLGYSVVSVLYQNNAPLGLNGFFGKAILTLTQSFALNWLYFEIDGSNLFQHAIRRHFFTSTWHFAHLPLILTLTLASASAARLVLAHDLSHDATPLDALTEAFQPRSLAHVEPGIRWYYCAGLSLALASLGAIALSHDHKIVPHARLIKPVRLALRAVVCLAILLLPLAGERLNSLQLIGTTTALVAGLVGVEVWGLGQRGQRMVGRGSECQYSAKLGKGGPDQAEPVYGGAAAALGAAGGEKKGADEEKGGAVRVSQTEGVSTIG